MKTKSVLLGIVCLFISLTTWGQQIGNGASSQIQNFNIPLPSGFYMTCQAQNGFPSFWAPEWMSNDIYMINLSAFGTNEPPHQFQIATSLFGDDRVFFRKLYPTSGSEWSEFATKRKNIFSDAQYLTKTGETGTSAFGDYTPKLYFGSFDDNNDAIWMARYNKKDNESDLRINIGDDFSGDDRFVVGNHAWNSPNFRELFVVSNNGHVGICVSNPQYALDVNGTIRAKEIIVETFGADFVFESDYKLKPLSEVKSHIEENKHLPDIV